MPELKLNIDSKFDKTLSDLVDSNDAAKTKADVIQRAVSTYQYLRTSLPKGSKIQVVDPSGAIVENDLQIP